MKTVLQVRVSATTIDKLEYIRIINSLKNLNATVDYILLDCYFLKLKPPIKYSNKTKYNFSIDIESALNFQRMQLDEYESQTTRFERIVDAAFEEEKNKNGVVL
jgi:hypothetical protein